MVRRLSGFSWLAFFLIFFFVMTDADDRTFSEPDFAYPQTVEANALKTLASVDGETGEEANVARLRAVLEICAAREAIDYENAFKQPAFIAGLIAALGEDKSAKALFLTLEAQKYFSIYMEQSWKYDRVDAPLLPYPEDVSEWSGLQFRTRIDSLLTEAVALSKGADVPLERYAPCIEADKVTLAYFPAVADFILYKNFDLRQFGRNDEEGFSAARAALDAMQQGSPAYFYWSVIINRLEKQAGQEKADEELRDLYSRWKDNEAARYLLLNIVDDSSSYEVSLSSGSDSVEETVKTEQDRQIACIEASLKHFPDWYGNNALKNRLSYLKQPKADFRCPSLVAPDTDFEIPVEYAYIKKISFSIYPLGKGQNSISKGNPIVRKTFEADKKSGKTSLSFRLEKPGRYIIEAVLDGRQTGALTSQIMVSPIIPFAVNNLDKCLTGVADFVSGAPVSDVYVDYNMRSYRSGQTPVTKTNIGQTGKNGMIAVTLPDKTGNGSAYLSYTYKGKTYDFDNRFDVQSYRKQKNDDRLKAVLFTDRALYHQGDSICWAAVVYRVAGSRGSESAVESGSRVSVQLKDGNYQTVDTVEMKTDALGRVFGTFKTEKGGLTGRYSIELTTEDNNICTTWVSVSDFKLPTFEVDIDRIERGVPGKGDITLSGVATTYSGMPVAGATVEVTLTGATRWRWFSPAAEIARYKTSTGADGRFSVVFASDTLYADVNNGRPYTDFIADAVVTSSANESQQVSRNFTTGKPYVLDATVKKDVCDTSLPVSIGFTATDADGKEASIALVWTLGTAESGKIADPVASGKALSGSCPQLDFSNVPAGVYSLQLAPENPELADTVLSSVTLTLYNEKKGAIPSGNGPLFIPATEMVASGDKAEILVGIRADKAYLFVIESEDGHLGDTYVRELRRGFHRINIDCRKTDNRKTVNIISVEKGNTYTGNVTVTKPEPEAPKLIAESFRDRLVPGATETWRFRFVDGAGAGIAGAGMLATMYNRALDEIGGAYRMPSFVNSYRPITPWIRAIYNDSRYPTTLYGQVKTLPEQTLQAPSWKFAGRIYGRMMARSYAQANGMNSVKMMKTEAMSYDMAVSEDAEEESAVIEGSVDAGNITAEKEPFDYRVSEVLQALWRPSLTTDEEGCAELSFEVPNAIGSWQFRTFAWSGKLQSATFMAQCLANKPVMVQPNLPRFLRQGDKATLVATVFNNTDSVQKIATVIEIFDSASGKTVLTKTISDLIAASGSATVSIDMAAPTDASSIGYRVRTASGSFSDGEQALIPVLSSSATVIESTEFYLNPGRREPYTIDVNTSGESSSTLQYCANPIWTVVKAMRGLRNSSTSSTGIAGELFSALAGKKIVADNPAIAEAIRQWKNNPSEKALTSMLSKNDALKKLLLEQTPWVRVAASETERMEALADFLDPAATEASVTASLAALARLQNRDGGFVWGPWSKESSQWATEVVLTTVGLAESLGMKVSGEDAPDMAAAFNYLQTQATRPKAPETNTVFALISTLLPQMKTSVAGQRLIHRTVGNIVKQWKKDDICGKAYDILILNANGRRSLASEILESIRQFGVEKEGMGLCFPSVNDVRVYATVIQAFAAMDAPRGEIDAMRQWIVVRAQATDNLGAYNPDYVIAGVMLTGTDWTTAEAGASVSVNGVPLEMTQLEKATGYFSASLPVSDGNIALSITPSGNVPSYGAVINISRRTMTDVPARPGKDLSIGKRFLVYENGQWKETTEFKAGATVRVQLTVKAARDLQYVSIDDERAATFEPVEQLPGYIYDGSLAFYRENLDASTRLFLNRLPKGTYHISYDMTAAQAGSFSSGIATLQSQYAPELTAHSGGCIITVND